MNVNISKFTVWTTSTYYEIIVPIALILNKISRAKNSLQIIKKNFNKWFNYKVKVYFKIRLFSAAFKMFTLNMYESWCFMKVQP